MYLEMSNATETRRQRLVCRPSGRHGAREHYANLSGDLTCSCLEGSEAFCNEVSI